ncbi:hypothetical protein ACHQM5_005235 [Ranunculus cassubicifolius]
MDLLLPISISLPKFSHRRPKFHTNPNNNGGKGISISFLIRSISLKSDQNYSSSSSSNGNEYLYKDDDDGEFLYGDDENTVEVIGIGSQKDAILDFCLESPFQVSFSHLRFWTILLSDSSSVQLQQRSIGKDIILRNMDLRASQTSTPRTVILVATAGYGSDHLTAIELLGAVKSEAGLAVGIVLKPFGFEGQRRHEEVTELVTKLQDHTNFCIVVDTDMLLKKEAVTLAEALKTANNAVLLSINSIFALTCETHKKLFDSLHTKKKELEVPELLKLLEGQEEARVGFGAANNFKSSIARAVFDCPFIGDGLKDLDGVAFCMLACATPIENSKLHSFLHIFRQTTGWQKDIVLSTVHEPNLEPNLFVTTVIICGATGGNMSPRNGFISGLAQRFPFVFSLLGRDLPNSKDPERGQLVESSLAVEDKSLPDTGEMLTSNSSDDKSRNPNWYPDERLTISGNNNIENQALSESLSEDKNIEGEVSGSDEEPFIWWNVGPNFRIAEEWAKERASISGSNPVPDNLCPYPLPVGVKLSQESIDTPKSSKIQFPRSRISKGVDKESPRSQNAPSWDALVDIYNNATSTILKGSDSNPSSNKQRGGLLSTRAASMLEGERDSEKRWTPNIEMQYRGGIYKGRCQGGLPEGKGSLTLVDGSIYDGMWRYGKKSGVGTFYYSNGDVFQGSWRDDLMHGKGWFYFRSGDRWFANFWKGKANGEGRFYSKEGEIFFGHFQDGWRHGQCLCISVDGVRWTEIWEEGKLLDRQKDGV